MAGIAIHLVSHDAEHGAALKAALEAESIPVTVAPTPAPCVVVAVVADDPWGRGQALKADNVLRVFVLCTGAVDRPPEGGGQAVVVRHWADAETAVMFIQQLLTAVEAERAKASPPAAPPVAGTPPPPAAAAETAEPEMVDAEALSSVEPDLVESPPVAATPSGAPPPLQARQLAPNLGEVSPEDLEFIQRVFVQVKDVDFRSPPPPPPRKALAGLDKKMQFLRDKVREMERDLARVGHIWRIKQAQFDAFDQIIAAKEAERSTSVQRYTQVKDQGTRAAAQHRGEAEALRNTINDLEATRNGLEGQLNRLRKESEQSIAALNARLVKEEQEKAALIGEFRAKMEAAQTAFTQLRDGSARTITDLESRLAARDEKLATTEAELATTQAAVVARDQIVEEQSRSLAEHAQSITGLGDELAGARADLERRTQELTAAAATTEAELNQRLAALSAELDATKADLERSRAALATTEAALASANQQVTAAKADLETKVGRAEAEVLAVKDSRQKIQERVSEREKTLSVMTEQMGREGLEHQERVTELKRAIQEKDERAQGLEGEVKSARAEFDQLAAEFARHREAAGKLSEELGQGLADARAEARAQKERIAELERDAKEWESRLALAQAEITELKNRAPAVSPPV
ncbi:MAG: hypothetical protein HY903_15570 [Deltaproteobacteria bacterium]|nr:hypothetical protein [Deltaproteobacteria bacterium]